MSSLERIARIYLKRDLTGIEIQTLTGKQPILYSSLKNFKTLEQLVGKEKAVIVLYQTSGRTVGHFVCVSINDKGIGQFFDPYGIHWGLEKMYGATFDEKLNHRYLNDLYEDYAQRTNTTVLWNNVDYQSTNKGISTCGRWSSVAFQWRNLTAQEMNKVFTGNSGFLADRDQAVVILTMLSLKDIRKVYDTASQTGGYL